MKNALSLNDDSLSGIINLGLSLEGSGSLDRMRRILQEIFADELQIVYEQPPGEGTEVFKHRQAVLRTFLPLKTPKSPETLFCASLLGKLRHLQSRDHSLLPLWLLLFSRGEPQEFSKLGSVGVVAIKVDCLQQEVMDRVRYSCPLVRGCCMHTGNFFHGSSCASSQLIIL